MSMGLRIRKMATTFALAVTVLAPAGMVIGNAAPASAVVSLGKLGRVEVNAVTPERLGVGGSTQAGEAGVASTFGY